MFIQASPRIFLDADVVAINKIDLDVAMKVDVEKPVRDAGKINPRTRVVSTSAKTGEGIKELITALRL